MVASATSGEATMWYVIAYLAGLVTIPAIVAAMGALIDFYSRRPHLNPMSEKQG